MLSRTPMRAARFCLAALAAVMLTAAPALHAAQPSGDACRFESLSAEQQKRYQSRYKRRLRNDGAAVADRWLYEQVCMTAVERRAAREKPVLDGHGRPCATTRTEMRVTPGWDGAMTMTPVRVCAR